MLILYEIYFLNFIEREYGIFNLEMCKTGVIGTQFVGPCIVLFLYDEKEKLVGEERMRELERIILLQVVDSKWMDHIDAMDQLRQGIGLRAIGQEDPVRAYQIEGFDMFDEMIQSIQEETLNYIYGFQVRIEAQPIERKQMVDMDKLEQKGGSEAEEEGPKQIKTDKVVGRNDLCPCGSGKKYKKCCGKDRV